MTEDKEKVTQTYRAEKVATQTGLFGVIGKEQVETATDILK